MFRLTFCITLLLWFASCAEGTATATETKPPAQIYIDSLKGFTIRLEQETNIKKLLCQQWEHAEDAADAKASGGGSSFEMVYRGFAFFDDGLVTQNPRGELHLGKWTFDEAAKTITVLPEDGPPVKYKINALAADELLLTELGEAGAKKQKYRANAFRHQNNTADPFYPANNRWRKQPRQSETDEAIAKRVKDCVGFYLKFYKDNLLRDSSTISFTGFPTCFNWYDGGIYTVKAADLELQWMTCFYDRSQALKAHALMEKMVMRKYQWTKGLNNWVVKNTKVLQQMYDLF